ncbi:hypothetical protein ILYODFUR_021326 [Ilyodon furcidens]|uniref:Secreted protein n=1 Tax=Ilyodon furcidens TaxID=33524 RepID=A0ABV0V4W8_9TELE
MVQCVFVFGGALNMLSVFGEFIGEVCTFKISQYHDERVRLFFLHVCNCNPDLNSLPVAASVAGCGGTATACHRNYQFCLPLPQIELGPAAIQSISRHVCNVMQCRRAQRPLPNKMGSSVSRELRNSGC